MKYIFFCILTFTFFVVNASSKPLIFPADDLIADKFLEYNIICLDEGPHGTLQTHKFIEDLISDKKISSILNYVLIEFANIEHQDILDQYISGKEVDLKDLAVIWRTTTQAHTPLFEMPVYLNLLKLIREINLNSSSNKIRVLACDPGIEWSKISSINQYFNNISQRDVLPSELAIKYGIDSGKKVLVIFGCEHLTKQCESDKDSTFCTIPCYINNKYPNSVYTIGCMISTASINTNNISFGAVIKSFDSLNFDALYYAGNPLKWEKDDPVKIDSEYWVELNRRSFIIWGEGIDQRLKLK